MKMGSMKRLPECSVFKMNGAYMVIHFIFQNKLMGFTYSYI